MARFFSIFYSLEVVGRDDETQIQMVVKNLII